ncbi:MAG: M23 family metallopeptidase [Candidatus Dormibacteraeota bacterium]|nr:M23 family metallopeptidase [Candidatus Dormibacteraeota bacterium]
MPSFRLRGALTAAFGLSLLTAQPALAAGNLTLPFAVPNPRVTSWTDHHYPNRQEDGIMIRFDGATGYAYDGHRGTDYAVPSNTPVVAADDGTVIYSEWSDSGGWGVVMDHAYDRTAYFHNNQLFVYPGQHVSRGQLIALSGSTGNSTGPHVHFEVRDLMTPWHSVDPYGWTGAGPDPWRWDMGNLWLNGTPTPFLLPLAFPGGARWNYWYGSDGPPPPVTWHLREGSHGLAGFAVQWDADPGAAAPRSQATSGTAAVPGPGSHTLHMRVFDRAGTSADITYLYLYDVDPPTSALRADPGGGALSLHWSGDDRLAGVKDVAIEVAAAGTEFRPWFAQSADQPLAGKTLGAVRYFGDPGSSYQFRLTVRDAARNAAPPVVLDRSISASGGLPPTVADRAILGPLPAQPDGAPAVGGVKQEHPTAGGAWLLGSDASLHGLGRERALPSTAPSSVASAVDAVNLPSGPLRLLADGTTWNSAGAAGPRFGVSSPVRLLAASDGTVMAVDAAGTIAGSGASVASALPAGATVVDAALFPGTHSGLALDSSGAVHAFGGADAALVAIPTTWALPGQPAAVTLAGTAQAPAGILTDANGDWQAFGSMLLLADATFSGPAFDPMTGLPVR